MTHSTGALSYLFNQSNVRSETSAVKVWKIMSREYGNGEVQENDGRSR